MKRTFEIASGLALTALAAPVGAQVASTQSACITQEEISALTVYAVPNLIAAVQVKCSSQISPNGFLATGADALAQRYATEKSAAWPLARSVLFKMGGFEAETDIEMFRELPDEAVRPLMDALIEQEIAKEITPGSCRGIEKMMEAVAPLETEEAGTLVAVIASLALQDDADICPIDDS